MNKIKEIIDNLNAFQIPNILPEQHISEQERANFYYFLTCAELSKRKAEAEEKDEHEQLVLKKVKLYPSYDGEHGYYSFNFKPNEGQYIDEEITEFSKNQAVSFNSVEELQQLIKLGGASKSKQSDEITVQDEKVILSLNILIQKQGIDMDQLINFLIASLLQESVNGLRKRYVFILEKYCKLIKQIAAQWVSQDYFTLTKKFIDSATCQQPCLYELLKELCDQCLRLKYLDKFEQYFKYYKDIIELVMKNKFNDRFVGMQCFITINHQGVLDFLKQLQYWNDEENTALWDLLQNEAKNKIANLTTALDVESSLNFIFYMGSKQTQVSKHAQLLSGLLQCSKNKLNSTINESIIMKLTKIKENESTKSVFRSIAKSITDWRLLNLNVTQLFCDFILDNPDQILSSKIYQAYLEQHLQERDEITDTFVQIIKQVFEQQNIAQIQFIAEKTSLDVLHKALIGQLKSLDLNQYLGVDSDRVLAKILFKRFLSEKDQLLKDNNFQLLKTFLQHLKEYSHTKDILEHLFQSAIPSGLIMALIWNCINPSKQVYMEDQIKKILQKQQYLQSEQIIKGLQKYKNSYPDKFNNVVDSLDDSDITKNSASTKARLSQLRLL